MQRFRRSASWIAWTWAACLLFPGCEASGGAWEPCAHLTAEPLNECSGMVHSRRTPDIFWVHNDSGDMPRLFAIERDGTLLAELRVQGAAHVDWEDITADDHGNLYIGDFGNNANKRTDLVIYVIPEPRLDRRARGVVLEAAVTKRIPFYYPEQRAFPDRGDKNYDCEAMFWDAGWLYLLTKHRSDTRTVLYRVPIDGEGRRPAQRISEFPFGSQVTGADVSPDGRRLVVLSYEYIYVFERPPGSDDFLAGKHHRVLIEGRQCEAICFDGERLLFANEQREIYCLRMDDLLQLETYLPEVPRLDVPRLVDAKDAAVAQGVRVALVPAPEQTAHPDDPHAPDVRLAWSARGLHVSATWSVLEPPGQRGSIIMHVMAGPPGDEPQLGPGQLVWEVRETPDAVRVRRVRPPPEGAWLPHVSWQRRGERLEFQAVIPVVVEPGTELAFNVIAYRREMDAEWNWSASSSAQPERNPLLWGRLRLRP